MKIFIVPNAAQATVFRSIKQMYLAADMGVYKVDWVHLSSVLLGCCAGYAVGA